jgi:hypothetical protein
MERCNDSSFSVENTPKVIFGPNPGRRVAIIVNDGLVSLFVRLRGFGQGDAPASLDSGIRLNAQGGSLVIDGNHFKGSIEAIAAAACLITAVEVYDT